MSGTVRRLSRVEFEASVSHYAASALPVGAYGARDGAHYLFIADGAPLGLAYRPGEYERIPAFSAKFPVFAWDEREMSSEHRVRFEDLPDVRPFRAEGGHMPEAIVAEGAGLMHFVVGPVHAGVIEPGRFTFSSGGETVAHLDAQLGYAFRGVERALEGSEALAAAPRVARICGSCSVARSYAYALALESLGGTEVSREADCARLVLCELERLYNHLSDLAASASAAGWQPGFAGGMALKERVLRINSLAAGHRFLFDAIVPGGVAQHVLREPAAVLSALADLAPRIERYLVALFNNSSVAARWHRTGRLSREIALAFGATGPAQRASHGTNDARAMLPYGAYRSIETRVAGATEGDAFARCAVKRDEIHESLRLARAALAELGSSPSPALSFVQQPAKGVAFALTEGPRGAEAVALHVGAGGLIERFHAISASYRNWPLVARAMEGNIVPDFPLVNKSFNLCYACADR